MLGRFVFSCFGLFPISHCWRNTKQCNQWVLPLQRRWGHWLGRSLPCSRKNQRRLSLCSLLQENPASLLRVGKPLVDWINFSFLVIQRIWNWCMRPQHLWDWLFIKARNFSRDYTESLICIITLSIYVWLPALQDLLSQIYYLIFDVLCCKDISSCLTVCHLLSKESL